MSRDDGTACESADVSWRMGATTLYATMTLPTGPGPFPAVVTVAGSGPTDRDWCSPLLPGSNGSARLIANELARHGIATLRYDKRFAGARAADNLPHLIGALSMASHAAELAVAVRHLASHPAVAADQIVVIANSEGTLHALNYQLQEAEVPLAGLVLIAPPGRPVADVARDQVVRLLAHDGADSELIKYYDDAVARFVAGEPVEPARALPEYVRRTVASLETPANLPFARELWTADPAPLLAALTVPVLVVIGRKDIQVDWRRDGDALQRAAAGHPNVAFAFPEQANHVLKRETRDVTELGADTEYNSGTAELDPESMTIVLAWIRALVSPNAAPR